MEQKKYMTNSKNLEDESDEARKKSLDYCSFGPSNVISSCLCLADFIHAIGDHVEHEILLSNIPHSNLNST